MPAKQIIIEVPDYMSEEEIQKRLQRLRWPSLSAEQEQKRSEQVELEAELLNQTALQLEKLSERLQTLETLYATRSGPIAEKLADMKEEMKHIKIRQTQQKQALELRDKRIADLQKQVNKLEI